VVVKSGRNAAASGLGRIDVSRLLRSPAHQFSCVTPRFPSPHPNLPLPPPYCTLSMVYVHAAKLIMQQPPLG